MSFFAGRTDGRVRISAIVGPDRTGCSSASGLAEPGSRYLRAARQTGGVIGSICDADFGTTLAAIGETAFTLRDRLPLTADPDPSQPMTVRVYPSSAACDADPDAQGGALLAEGTGWRYDAASNEVFFTAAGIPPRGACALVRYTIMCLPYIP